jgi:hypothetical protein
MELGLTSVGIGERGGEVVAWKQNIVKCLPSTVVISGSATVETKPPKGVNIRVKISTTLANPGSTRKNTYQNLHCMCKGAVVWLKKSVFGDHLGPKDGKQRLAI